MHPRPTTNTPSRDALPKRTCACGRRFQPNVPARVRCFTCAPSRAPGATDQPVDQQAPAKSRSASVLDQLIIVPPTPGGPPGMAPQQSAPAAYDAAYEDRDGLIGLEQHHLARARSRRRRSTSDRPAKRATPGQAA